MADESRDDHARISRRTMLRTGGAAAVASLGACGRSKEPEASTGHQAQSLKRALSPDPLGILELPKGFRVRVLQRVGERMSDGYRVPGRPDAMACFAGPDGSWILMRNHELAPVHFAVSAYDASHPAPAEAYDPKGLGGVSRLVINPQSLEVKRSNLVLTGTELNCAGGTSPWGFLTCEETTSPNHGFVFLCATDAADVAPPKRIPAYGRFVHEAAAVDPATHIAYLTEDRVDGCFYRCVPTQKDSPFVGTLQALRVKGKPQLETGALGQGTVLAVDWVDVAEPTPDDDTVRLQAQERGAALVRRGEGLWLSGNDVFFTATIGGALERGQIFRLRTDQSELEVLAEATAENELDMPDNLTVSPHGSLYVCEDGYEGNSLRRLSLDGRFVDFARNIRSPSELAGACFSPDGRVMFVNLQTDGLTLAIEGPFDRELAADARAARERNSSLPNLGLGSGLALLALTAFARTRKR
jgi:secreted PhoX family phosphatase